MTKDYWDYPLFQRINQEMTPSPRDCTAEDVANYAFSSHRTGGVHQRPDMALDGGWSTTKYLVQKALLAERIDAKPAS